MYNPFDKISITFLNYAIVSLFGETCPRAHKGPAAVKKNKCCMQPTQWNMEFFNVARDCFSVKLE